MSTHRLISRRRRVFHLPAFSVLGGLLLAVQLWLPAPAFATARQNSPSLTQDVARAGVSVVRLLAYYSLGKTTDASPATPTAACTGLGVLISSRFKPETKKYENWVLTDGNLVNSEEQATCLDTSPTALLSHVDIYTNSAYSSQPLISSSVTKPAVTCLTRPAKCSQGPALFSFASDRPQPFLDFPVVSPAANTTPAAQEALQLASSDNTVGTLNPSSQDAKHLDEYKKQLQAFLVPNLVPTTSNRSLEPGAPFVDSSGSLSGLYLSQAPSMTAEDIQSFVKREMSGILDVSNPVHDNWKSGMDAYYTNHSTTDAHTYFTKAFQANPQFEAAQRFANLSTQTITIQARKASSVPSASSAPSDQPSSFQLPSLLKGSFLIAGFTIPYWLLAAAAAVLLLVFIVIIVLLLSGLGRRRRRKRALAADLAHAQRLAAIEAPRMAEMEASQKKGKEVHHANGMYNTSSEQGQPPMPIQYSPVSQQPVGDQESFPSVSSGLHCPRCGEENAPDATSCANCHLQLSSTEAGLPSRNAPPVFPAPVRTPTISSLSAPPPLARSVADHPTFVPGLPLTEQPTIDMATMAQDESQSDLEKTVPYSVRHLNGQHLGFVVGTRSDPGIKRKYKPNEDSLFAAQGVLSPSSLPQLFGLFVVADGMGGHANGEDASRLAIQTIADYMLPLLTKASAVKDEQYIQLLVEGIQQANLAVHKNNVLHHGDMGTTVTATLLVDTVAYVANVGDSRTYLYRPSEGLKKVTVDHSVVASLVEAGIIKPDDIYTHPKRNQIYRSLGEKAAVEVDSFTVQLQAGDKLLLCSDGLWDMVRDPKIEAVIKNADPNPSVTGEALVQSALEGGGEDNVSVIVVHVTEGLKSAMPRFQLLTKPDSVQLPQL